MESYADSYTSISIEQYLSFLNIIIGEEKNELFSVWHDVKLKKKSIFVRVFYA